MITAKRKRTTPTKAERRLEARRKDFDAGSQASNRDRQGSRWASGGFHRPGSFK